MPNMNVYLSDELYNSIKEEIKEKNLKGPSAILQPLLEAHYKKVKR
jgi:hypothetical protein